MQSLTRRVWQRTDIAVLIACLISGTVLMIFPLSWKTSIGQAVVGTVFAPLEKPLYHLRSLVDSRRENRELRQEMARLSLENAGLRQAAAENVSLREMLALRERWQWRFSAADVVARQPGMFTPELLIDKGSHDGLAEGMVVISQQGLVGRISSTDERMATVQTVFHPDLRISALDCRSRVLGILRYRVGYGMTLDRVPLKSDIHVGDTVVSSGYGGVMPFGQMLGTVEKAAPNELRLSADVRIRPALDLDRLSQVFVITGGAPPPVPRLAGPPADSLDTKPKMRRPAIFRPELSIRPTQPRVVAPDSAKPGLEDGE